jgi:hypothetical protein
MRIKGETPVLREEGGITRRYEKHANGFCLTPCPIPSGKQKVGSHACTQCKHFVWREQETQEVRCIAGI